MRSDVLHRRQRKEERVKSLRSTSIATHLQGEHRKDSDTSDGVRGGEDKACGDTETTPAILCLLVGSWDGWK